MFQVEEMALMKLLEQDSVNPQQKTMELFSKTSQVIGVRCYFHGSNLVQAIKL